MADARIRNNTAVIPKEENIITPNTKIEEPNQYDSVLARLQELEDQNRTLTKQVAEAKGDISEKVKESKRKYWYNINGSRKADELFKYRYNCLIDESIEKVVIETKTIARPVHYQNSNTGKWVNEHNIEVLFHDGTKTKIDVLDYINQKFQYEDFVSDSDMTEKDGKIYYTFHTEKFGDFTIAQNFIN